MKTEKISNKRDHAPKKTIVLVGIMGAGKSTVGKILADRLGMQFIDADQEIERAAGCTITDFFEKYGEVEFRKGEERVISRILAGEPCVLATGGGAFMSEATRLLIKNIAIPYQPCFRIVKITKAIMAIQIVKIITFDADNMLKNGAIIKNK